MMDDQHKIGDKFRIVAEFTCGLCATRQETIDSAVAQVMSHAEAAVIDQAGNMWDEANKPEQLT